MRMRVWVTVIAFAAVWTSPVWAYPKSTVITGVEFIGSHQSAAPGSDNFPVTWGKDGNIYTSWGDGGGFGGTNSDSRVSLGFARISGGPTGYSAVNVMGGKNSVCPATRDGKVYGLVDINGILYAWRSPGSNNTNFSETVLYKSTSSPLGCTWTPTSVKFTQSQNLILPSVLQFGPGYTDTLDNYVYIYATRLKDSAGLKLQSPGQTDLMRVPKDKIESQSAYEYFSGTAGSPAWTSSIGSRKPVFEVNSGVGWAPAVVVFNKEIGRFILTVDHAGTGFENYSGKGFGIYEAPHPWGPWSEVYLSETWIKEPTFFYNFSTKWAGRDSDGVPYMYLIYSGAGSYDAYNMVKVRFTVNSGGNPSPTATTAPTSTNWREMLVGWLLGTLDGNGDGKVNSLDWAENL